MDYKYPMSLSQKIINLENAFNTGGGAHLREKNGLYLTLIDQYHDNIQNLRSKSPSQLSQDLYVLAAHNFKRNGFFIEFGAANGYTFSNTWLLEKEFGWSGILAEPARCFHNELKNNRSCNIEFDCVWNESDKEVQFREFGELSTIDTFTDCDFHAEKRKNKEVYTVKTISIMDLLKKYDAPQKIDYLSIDTEGSELEILKSLDFNKYKIDIITCEHNHTPLRTEIKDFLYSKGYEWVNKNFSDFDDWYKLK
jgi:FkbM family methyltransferase